MVAILQTTFFDFCMRIIVFRISLKFKSRVNYKPPLPQVMAWRPNKRRGLTWIDVNTLRPRQNGRHFPDDIFKCIFLNEKFWIPIKISLKFVPKGPINNIPAMVQIMAWRRPGDKPLSEPMMVNFPTHICVTRPQWVSSNISDAVYGIIRLATLRLNWE